MNILERKALAQDERAILHFDYDCFYAQVIENKHPALKSLPLGIKQKSILATCNYVARGRGVKKLMPIFEARQICPDLVLADGEDLTPFRDASKALYRLLRSYSWNGKAERLGLDEVFLDVTDIVSYNMELLNPNALNRSFFCLSREEPEKGFGFDATACAGCCVAETDGKGSDSPPAPPHQTWEACQPPRTRLLLLLASHLAYHLRLEIEAQGYTSACGIATNKALSKMAGNQHKPRAQTTLLAMRGEDVLSFLDRHPLRSIPGIGGKMTRILEGHILGRAAGGDAHSLECSVTVDQVRTHPGMNPQLLERLLGGVGFERGVGAKVWDLLHGIDDSEVKAASVVPTQISIEDTYVGLRAIPEVRQELIKLSSSLVRRMRVDLLGDDPASTADTLGAQKRKWIARPKTLQLTARPKYAASEGRPYNFNRASRSQPLPGFVFNLVRAPDELAEQLTASHLLPMFHSLNPTRPGGDGGAGAGAGGWNIGLLNVCVANMALTGADSLESSGRDISAMFRRQDEVLREWTVYDSTETPKVNSQDAASPKLCSRGEIKEPRVNREREVDLVAGSKDGEESGETQEGEDEEAYRITDGSKMLGQGDQDQWDGEDVQGCEICGHAIPGFAVKAHGLFHMLEDGGPKSSTS